MRKLKSLVISRFTAIILTIMLVACGGSTVQVVVTATPSPTAVSDAVTPPVDSSPVVNGELSIERPTPDTASEVQVVVTATLSPIAVSAVATPPAGSSTVANGEPSVEQPTPDATPAAGPSPTTKPLPPELTDGVQALVRCAGETEVYWLEHGPPRMTPELVQCLNDGLTGE